MKRILVIAGEASSDIHAANLVKSILSIKKKNIEFSGLGGENLISTEHFIAEFNNKDFAVFGAWELLGHLKKLFYAQKHFKDMASLGAYDLAVLIDYPDFNISLAKHLTKLNIPVIYYITPQVWVWRSSRVYKLAKYCREILTVFPFEKEFYAKHGVTHVKYVGHPLIENINNYFLKRDMVLLKEKFKVEDDRKIIAVLPGSRRSEIKYIFPIMIDVCRILKQKYSNKLRFIIPVAATLELKDIICYIPENDKELFEFVEKNTYDLYSVADYVLLASGTSTVESALFELPMTIVYKVSAFSAFIFKYFIRYKKPIGMVNILLNKIVVNEFFQKSAKQDAIVKDIENNLFDEQKYLSIKQELKKIKNVLHSDEYASLKTAKEVLKYL